MPGHEVAAARRLGRWDRVSVIIYAALAKTLARGDVEEGLIMIRVNILLISAAIACERPERGL